jgi:hypothetical protein
MLGRIRTLAPSIALLLSLLTAASALAEDSERTSRRKRRESEEQTVDEDTSSTRRSRRHRRHRDEADAGVEAGAANSDEAAASSRTAAVAGTRVAKKTAGDAVAATAVPAAPPPNPLPYTAAPPRREVLTGTSSIDVKRLKEDELRLLNTTIEQKHDDLQASDRCESLRLATRVPMREWMYREHSREVFLGVGVFMLAAVGLAFRSRLMRTLMPLPPLVAAGYLVYASITDTQALQDTISRGLQACSTALPEGSANSSAVVQKRLDHVTRIHNAIEDTYGVNKETIDAVLERYKL